MSTKALGGMAGHQSQSCSFYFLYSSCFVLTFRDRVLCLFNHGSSRSGFSSVPTTWQRSKLEIHACKLKLIGSASIWRASEWKARDTNTDLLSPGNLLFGYSKIMYFQCHLIFLSNPYTTHRGNCGGKIPRGHFSPHFETGSQVGQAGTDLHM